MPDLAASFETLGFADVEAVLSTVEVDEVRERIEAIAEGRVPDYPPGDIHLEPGAAGVQSARTVRKLNRCAENDALFMRLAASDKILGIVQTLLGPDIKLFGSQIFMKPPGGVDKPYHQDSPYFSIEPMALVTCWIAIDETTLENGCLWVIPGSHHWGPLPHSEPWIVGDQQDMRIPEASFDGSGKRPILLAAGSCSFHHSLLVHMSHPNRTQSPRRGVAFHYMSARSRWTDASRPQPDYPLLSGHSHPGCV